MKTVLFTALVAILLSPLLAANTIRIRTELGVVRYELYGEKQVIENLEGIVAVIARNAKRPKYYVDIEPDRRTPFDTILQLLVRLKEAGVTSFRVIGNDRNDPSGGWKINYSILNISSKNLQEDYTTLHPPPAR